MQSLKRFILWEVDSTERICSDPCHDDDTARCVKKYLTYSALILSLLILLLPLKEFCKESGGKNIIIRLMCTLHNTLHSIVLETKNYVFTIGTIVWDFVKDVGVFIQREVRNLLPPIGKSNKPIAKCPDCDKSSKPATGLNPIPSREPSIASKFSMCDCK